MTPVIGVAITTRNRPRLLAKARKHWRRHLPPGSVLVIVDDASEPPNEYATVRLPERGGVARAKNASLTALMDAGCEHLFLADDDVWPVVDDWWQPFVTDPEPHLMLLWGSARRLSRTAHYEVHRHPRGVLLYAERRVVDRVGGMHPEFGIWGSEHVEWSRRIHDAGLTRAAYAMPTGALAAFHAEDMGRPGETGDQLARRRRRNTTVNRAERTSFSRRQRLLDAFEGSTEFVDYRRGQE